MLVVCRQWGVVCVCVVVVGGGVNRGKGSEGGKGEVGGEGKILYEEVKREGADMFKLCFTC